MSDDYYYYCNDPETNSTQQWDDLKKIGSSFIGWCKSKFSSGSSKKCCHCQRSGMITTKISNEVVFCNQKCADAAFKAYERESKRRGGCDLGKLIPVVHILLRKMLY